MVSGLNNIVLKLNSYIEVKLCYKVQLIADLFGNTTAFYRYILDLFNISFVRHLIFQYLLILIRIITLLVVFIYTKHQQMRNFNKDEIQKYEKMTKNAFNKINIFKGLTSKIPNIKRSHIISSIFLTSLVYIGYRMYDYKKYQGNHYVDIFTWKQNVSAKIRRADLFEKMRNLSLEKNRQSATNNYQKILNEQMDKIIQKIKQKCIHEEYQENSKPKSKSKRKQKEKTQKSSHNHAKQIILSKDMKSKLDLGYIFKLHSKIYASTLTSNGDYIKKTYIIPIMIFDTPFFVTKKQQVKSISKNKRYSKFIQGKGKFDLSSECKNINYWNVLMDNKEKQVQMEQKNAEISLNQRNKIQDKGATIKQQNKSVTRYNDSSNKRKQNKQLLFQCRNRIKKVQLDLKTKLKDVIDKNWQNKGKTQNSDEQNNFSSSSITTWEHIKEKEK